MTNSSKIKVPPIDPKMKAKLDKLVSKKEVLIQNELPDTLSIEEAIAVMINLPSINAGDDIEPILDKIFEESEAKFAEAKDQHTRDVWSTIIKLHFYRLQLAMLLKEVLEDELHSLKQGYESKLRIDKFTPEPHDIATSSLVDWAKDIKFGIKNFTIQRQWRSFRGRRYSTPYLEIIDDVIEHFYEEGGSGYDENQVPPNKKIQSFIKKNYKSTPEHMIESICTILKKQQPRINGPIIKTGTTTVKVGDTGNRIVTNKIR